MTSIQWQPYKEPLITTLARNVTIALVVGAVLARWSGGISRWPMLSLIVLWPALGGHGVELWFLNWVRPRLSPGRATQVLARIAVWFIGGTLLGIAMAASAAAVIGYRVPPWPWWLAGGVAFIGVELVAQLALQLRGRPSFYNGRG